MKATALAITNDGKWAIAAGIIQGSDFTGVGVAAYVPELNNYDSIAAVVFGSASPNAVAMTNDHLWAITGHEDGTVGVYYFNAQLDEYPINQTIKPNNISVVSLSISNDHQYLAIGYDGN